MCVATRLTVADLVSDLALEGKRIAVEMNGEIVPRSRYGETPAAPGDGSRSSPRSAAADRANHCTRSADERPHAPPSSPIRW